MARRQSFSGLPTSRAPDERVAAELRQLNEILPSSGKSSGPLRESVKSPVTVLCRFRAQSAADQSKGGFEAWDLGRDAVNGKATSAAAAPSFHFDRVFAPDALQAEVHQAVQPLMEDFLGGINCAILCYGQTSAGKTYTMAGPRDAPTCASRGLVPRMLAEVFHAAKDGEQFRLSMLEIYQERLRDLLNPAGNSARLRILEDRSGDVSVQGLHEVGASNCAEALSYFWKGTQRRTTAATGMNDTSSRSHCIFILTREKIDGAPSKFYFVDLAGSESVKKAGLGTEQSPLGGHQAVNAELSEEAKSINQSLSTLGLVLCRLVERRKSAIIGGVPLDRRRTSVVSASPGSTGTGQEPHVPYRSSKLTRVLQGVLSGNTRTTLVINCSLSSLHAAETISTLRFGQRARSLITNIKSTEPDAIDAESSSELLRTLCAAREEIQRLRLVAAESPCLSLANPVPDMVEEELEPPEGNFESPRSRPTTPCRIEEVDACMLDDSASLDASPTDVPAPHSAPPTLALRLPLSSVSRPRLALSAAMETTPCFDLSPASSPHVQPRRLHFFHPASSPNPSRVGAGASVSASSYAMHLPAVPAGQPQPLSLQAALCSEAQPMSWEYPLTRKDCCLRAMLAQDQRCEETAARLIVAEAELEWLQYLTPGGADVGGTEHTEDNEEETAILDHMEPVVEEAEELSSSVTSPREALEVCTNQQADEVGGVLPAVVPPSPEVPDRPSDMLPTPLEQDFSAEGCDVAACELDVSSEGASPELDEGSADQCEVLPSNISSPKTEVAVEPELDCALRPGDVAGSPSEDISGTWTRFKFPVLCRKRCTAQRLENQ